MIHGYESVDLGVRLASLARDQAEWSQATFGIDEVKGPLGCLKHLEKEAREAQADPTDRMEYADCLLLILDASRRAGMRPIDLLEMARQKMVINRQRKWNPTGTDEPTEHERSVAS